MSPTSLARANGDYYVTAAASALANDPIYVDSDASLSNANAIASELESSNVAVVALPSIADDGMLNANQLASQILDASSGYDTVIVTITGGTPFAVAGPNQNGISTILYGNLPANGNDVGATILASADELTAPATVTSTGDGSVPAGADEGGSVVGIASGILGTVVVLTAALAVAMKVHKRNQTSGSAPLHVSYEHLPADLKGELATFLGLVGKHSTSTDARLAPALQGILANVQELFKRIDRKGTPQQRNLASVTYIDTFSKLNKALGEDYYLDIQAKPDLWDNPQRRLQEVRDAVAATDNQIVQNIRQVNASQDLDFKASLESLTRSMDTPTVTDMFTNKKDENYS